MKKLFQILALGAALCALVSCGGSPMKISPSKEAISGPLGQYFKIVNREYKVVDRKVSVDIQRIAEGLPDPWDEEMKIGFIENCYEPGFVFEFTDEDGDVVEKETVNVMDYSDALNSIMALSAGESTSLIMYVSEKTIKKFRVSSTFECNLPKEKDTVAELASKGESLLDEVVNEYTNVLDEVKKEVNESYTEAASEVLDAMTDVIGSLF